MKTLLTAEEVAERLRIPRATLATWRARNYGPPGFRVGRGLRYRAEDVDRFVSELAAAAASRNGAMR